LISLFKRSSGLFDQRCHCRCGARSSPSRYSALHTTRTQRSTSWSRLTLRCWPSRADASAESQPGTRTTGRPDAVVHDHLTIAQTAASGSPSSTPTASATRIATTPATTPPSATRSHPAYTSPTPATPAGPERLTFIYNYESRVSDGVLSSSWSRSAEAVRSRPRRLFLRRATASNSMVSMPPQNESTPLSPSTRTSHDKVEADG
jgi:hypothetical protein